jgi:hypothetical protein
MEAKVLSTLVTKKLITARKTKYSLQSGSRLLQEESPAYSSVDSNII